MKPGLSKQAEVDTNVEEESTDDEAADEVLEKFTASEYFTPSKNFYLLVIISHSSRYWGE